MRLIKSSRYFNAHFRYIFMLALLPIFVFSCLFVHTSYVYVDEYTQSLNEQLLGQIRDEVDSHFNKMEYTMSQIVYSPKTLKAMETASEPFNYATVKNISFLSGQLLDIQSLMSKGNTVDIGIDLISNMGGWMIRDRGYYALENISYEGNRYQYVWSLLDQYNEYGMVSYHNNINEQSVLYVRKIMSSDTRSYGMLIAKYPTQFFQRLLGSYNMDGYVALLDRNNAPIAQNSNMPDDMLADLSQYINNKHEYGRGTLKYKSAIWDITFIESTQNNWKYVIALPSSHIYNELLNRLNPIMIIILSTLLIVSIMTFVLSKRMYNPIVHILSMIHSNDQNKKHDEIKIIENYLISQDEKNRLLESTVQQQYNLIKYYFLNLLMLGKMTNQEIASITEKLGISDTRCNMVVVATQVMNLDGSVFHNAELPSVLFEIGQIVEDAAGPQLLVGTTIIDRNHVALIRMNEGDASIEDVVCAKYEHAQRTVSSRFRLFTKVGLSLPFCDIADTPKAYSQANEVIISQGLKFSSYCCRYSQATININHFFPNVAQYADDIINALRVDDLQGARQKLNEFVKAFFAYRYTTKSFQLDLAKFVLMLEDFWRNYSNGGADAPISEENISLSSIFILKDSSEVELWLCENYLIPIHSAIQTQGRINQKRLAKAVADIIANEYNTPLSLEYCASKVGYHPVYVSRCFKEVTGFSFLDYLLMQRMKIAKDLLRNTDMQIQEISAYLCYNNSQNFIRLFKRMAQITPGKYRQLHKLDKIIPDVQKEHHFIEN